jgi:hypothetical protein
VGLVNITGTWGRCVTGSLWGGLVVQELAAAQEAAAAALGHVEQYKAIATSSDDALKRMQASHEAFKVRASEATVACVHVIFSIQSKLLATPIYQFDIVGKILRVEIVLGVLEGLISVE